MNGSNALIKEAPELPHPFSTSGYSEKTSVYEPGRRASPDTKSVPGFWTF